MKIVVVALCGSIIEALSLWKFSPKSGKPNPLVFSKCLRVDVFLPEIKVFTSEAVRLGGPKFPYVISYTFIKTSSKNITNAAV